MINKIIFVSGLSGKFDYDEFRIAKQFCLKNNIPYKELVFSKYKSKDKYKSNFIEQKKEILRYLNRNDLIIARSLGCIPALLINTPKILISPTIKIDLYNKKKIFTTPFEKMKSEPVTISKDLITNNTIIFYGSKDKKLDINSIKKYAKLNSIEINNCDHDLKNEEFHKKLNNQLNIFKLDKIKTKTYLMSFLKKNEIICNSYLRNVMKKVNYYDVVCSLNPLIKEKYKLRSIHSGGKGFNKKCAVNSCAGEIIERVSLMKEVKLKEKILDLSEFFYEKELSRFKLKIREKIPYVKMKNYFGKNFAEIPGFLVFPNLKNSKILSLATSVGCSFSIDLEDSIKGGVFECIERHSIMHYWYNNLKIKKIKYVPKKLIKISNNLRKEGIRIIFYDLSTNIPCNVICCVLKYGGKMVFGTSAGIDCLKLFTKSLAEALQLYTSQSFISKSKSEGLENSFKKLINNTPLNFSQSYCYIRKKTLKELMNYLKKNRIDILYKNITLKNFKKVGFVTKVFIPDLLQFIPKNRMIYRTNYKEFKNKRNNPFI